MFEKALQAVNPSVSLPYWDFTLESTFYEPATFRSSAVFSEDWFGDAAPTATGSADLHTVTKGRFAHVSVMQNAVNFSTVVSPYGMLRSPVTIYHPSTIFALALPRSLFYHHSCSGMLTALRT